MKRQGFWVCLYIVLVIGLISGGRAQGQDHDFENLRGENWKSEYITGKKRYSVKFLGSSSVQVGVDGNRCMFNYIGEVSACTRMGIFLRRDILEEDFSFPVAQDTSIYNMEKLPYRLVVKEDAHGRRSAVRFLILDKGRVVESFNLNLRPY